MALSVEQATERTLAVIPMLEVGQGLTRLVQDGKEDSPLAHAYIHAIRVLLDDIIEEYGGEGLEFYESLWKLDGTLHRSAVVSHSLSGDGRPS